MTSTPAVEAADAALSSKPSPHALWISLVWGILFAKCGLLTEGIIHYNVPIDPAWIWAPTFIAALLLTYFLLRDKTPRG